MIEIGIENQRREIVLLATATQALEIDHPNFVILHQQVLRLEVAMDKVPRGGSEAFRKRAENGIFAQRFGIQAEVVLDEVFEEILLLPAIEPRVEGRHEMKVLRGLCVEEPVDLLEGRAVKREARGEGLVFQ